MNKTYRFIILLFVLLLQEQIFGQETSNQLWADYALNVNTNSKISFGGDVGLRGDLSNYEWSQFLLRPTLNYTFNKTFSGAFAIALFHTNNKFVPNVTEFRIHQEININWFERKWISIFGRLRIEERFFWYQEESLPNEFRVRGRLLMGIQSPDITWFGTRRPIYFQSTYEGFLTFGSDDTDLFINQGRFRLAFGHRIAPNWHYEIHYIRQSSRLTQETGLKLAQNLFRLRVFHTINMNKSKSLKAETGEDSIIDFN